MMMMMPTGGGGRRRCPLLGGETELFCASLAEGLAHLERTLEVDGASGGVSMRWCADAMRVVKRMQREMLAIFRNADVAPAAMDGKGGGGGCWFEQYMQETAALLDFCNAFKAAISRMHRYCMLVDFAAQAGGAAVAGIAAAPCDSPVAAVREKLTSVKAAVAEAEQLGRSADAGGMVVVTLVAKITMAVVSVFVLQALTSRSALDAPALGCAAVFPELEPWHKSLSLIHGRFPSRATVAEHEKVSMAVQELISGHGGDRQEEQVRTHVELVRARSGELREGVEMFDSVLDEVFDEVIKGRNEMLGILRDKALI